MAKDSKKKYYVVWVGAQPGIYDNWKDCEKQVKGASAARYKSFDSLEQARVAFSRPYDGYIGQSAPQPRPRSSESCLVVDADGICHVREGVSDGPELCSLAVDAACSGNPGVMEYRGVYIRSCSQLFHFKAQKGTNNIGEFLAIVHGLSYIEKEHLDVRIIYSDSVNAINWVRQHRCKSKLPLQEDTSALWDIVHRAERWLDTHTYTTEIRKWDTARWGEIPADFGRK